MGSDDCTGRAAAIVKVVSKPAKINTLDSLVLILVFIFFRASPFVQYPLTADMISPFCVGFGSRFLSSTSGVGISFFSEGEFQNGSGTGGITSNWKVCKIHATSPPHLPIPPATQPNDN